VIAELVALRQERARLLGFENHATFTLATRMAKTPQAALDLINRVWVPARERALEERAALSELAKADGISTIKGWDWRYYSEKVRKARFDLDEAEVKPYLQLDNMLAAQFHVGNRLFGLSFSERKDVPVYHPDVRVWEVKDRAGRHVGLFYGDFFARPTKQSGAWMSSFRIQDKLDGPTTPLIVNNLNANKPSPGQPALLSYDDAETLFHEFGHALHGLLSNVTYRSLAGTSVPTDFVEFPAQIFEHWLGEPQILQQFARHYKTAAPMPKALLDKVMAARNYGQGFATVEFLASAFVDMDIHTRTDLADFDVNAIEAATRARIGVPEEIVLRHRPPHFGHIFSGGYSAGYYSYMWSEVLDADGFDAFKETGDIFNPVVAQRLYRYVYSAGDLREADEAYRLFRGRAPAVEPLLRNRGFLNTADSMVSQTESTGPGAQ
jgi:peptidyl-dipeptidase Dcp